MIVKNTGYAEMAGRVRSEKRRIILYGAGMIGQIVMPYILKKYGLLEAVDCYVDRDPRKQGQKIAVDSREYTVMSPDILYDREGSVTLLITNSHFDLALDFLEGIAALSRAEAYIIPMMQLYELRPDKIPLLPAAKEPMIPKKLHYCWFSKQPMPDFLRECVRTWERLCPDYEILCWNEANYEIERIPYAKEAFARGRYGFVSDAARLDILYQHGGIYMDTDVTLFKRPDVLLHQPAFVGVEKWGNINTGGMAGAVQGHPMIGEMLAYRSRFHFILEDGSENTETNGLYETYPFLRHGMRIDNTLQTVNGVTVYPSSVFHPYDYMSGESRIEDWTISEHHFYGSWLGAGAFEERKRTQEKYREIVREADLRMHKF